MNLWKYYNGNLKYPDLNNHSYEKEIAKTNPNWAFEYILEYGKDKELEPIIAKDSKYSYIYADEILIDEFKLGEKAIAKDSYYSYLYALIMISIPLILFPPDVFFPITLGTFN
jgi:hypothetical protein